MGRTLSDAPALIAAREPFVIGALSGVSHYPNGLAFPPNKGWNTVVWPRTGVLYIVYSFYTPIAWIDQWGRAKRSPEKFSQRTARHQGLLYTLKDDPKITGRKRDRDMADKIDAERIRDHYDVLVTQRRQQQREAARRRYWTPERLAAKEVRDQARAVAQLYGIKVGEARKALTQAPEEFTMEEAIASLMGERVHTRDATIRQ